MLPICYSMVVVNQLFFSSGLCYSMRFYEFSSSILPLFIYTDKYICVGCHISCDHNDIMLGGSCYWSLPLFKFFKIILSQNVQRNYDSTTLGGAKTVVQQNRNSVVFFFHTLASVVESRFCYAFGFVEKVEGGGVGVNTTCTTKV